MLSFDVHNQRTSPPPLLAAFPSLPLAQRQAPRSRRHVATVVTSHADCEVLCGSSPKLGKVWRPVWNWEVV